jgi:hypothetical protein
MDATELTAGISARGGRIGVYLAFLQLIFTLLWTTYVIYLPKLGANVGIAPTAVILILMMDQAIFTITDTAMGIAADRIAALVGRLGVYVGVLTVVSCAAFVALPYVAALGSNAKALLIALIVIWAITSSALRAPPLILLGKYRAKPEIPFLSALGLSRVERGAATETPARQVEPAKPFGTVPVIFIVAMVALALGYQLHFSINSAPFFLRFAKPDDLQWLMPVFWIGFNIAMFPASVIVKHRGGLLVMGAAGLFGAVAVIVAELAGDLSTLVIAQFVAGSAWGCMLMSAVSAALAIGHTGAEGRMTGLVFSALALATFARMAAVAGSLQKLPDYAPLLHWAPVACWSVAGCGLLVVAASRAQRGEQL